MSEYINLVCKVRQLKDELAAAERQLEVTEAARRYDIALRPDDPADPDRMDDIVVNNVSMFRAEQMGRNHWWVACYFGDEPEVDALVFDVYARSKPTRIDWILRERPHSNFVYEDQQRT